MAKVVRAVEDRAADSPEAADLDSRSERLRRPARRLCRDYAKESIHGYCALRVTEARTALLETRLDELAAAAAGKAASEKPTKTKAKKGAKEP